MVNFSIEDNEAKKELLNKTLDVITDQIGTNELDNKENNKLTEIIDIVTTNEVWMVRISSNEKDVLIFIINLVNIVVTIDSVDLLVEPS